MAKRAKVVAKKKAVKKGVAKKAAARAAVHPKLTLLLQKLPPGRYAGGTLIVTKPDLHREEMGQWLMGKVEGRVALGRTAFGDLLIFRDLRAHAAELGDQSEADACDVALIDLNYKKMTVLGYSVEEFLKSLDDRQFQDAFLRRPLYDEVKARLGDFGDDQAYTFVPALGLGGDGDAASVQLGNWLVYQSILFQL